MSHNQVEGAKAADNPEIPTDHGKRLIQRPKVSISRLSFSGGDIFDLKPNEKIIVVGPNNAGKSQLLREIISIAKMEIKSAR